MESHFGERLKSPFAGAFLAAWVAVNWKAVLILCFSTKSIEDRIGVLLEKHVTLYAVLLEPLWLAFLLTLGFYVLSSAFLIFLHCYRLAQQKIERWFDLNAGAWIQASRVVEIRKGYNSKIASLEAMAADNAAGVEAANDRATTATEKAIELQEELAVRSRQLSEHVESLRKMSESSALATADSKRLSVENDRLRSENADISVRLVELQKRLSEMSTLAEPHRATDDFLLSAQRMNELAQLAAGVGSTILFEPATESSIGAYLATRYPGLVVDRAALSKILADVKKAEISHQLTHIGMVKDVLWRASDAIAAHKEIDPEVYSKATDYLSKSIGFVFPVFREVHPFSGKTKSALKKLSGLVKKS